MAIEVSCPECGEEFRVRDDAAGKAFKCKVCGTTVRVPGVDEYDEDDDDDDEDYPPPRRRSRDEDDDDRPRKRKRKSSGGGKTLGPAIGLYVVGGLWLLYTLFNIVVTFATADGEVFTPPPALDPAFATGLFYVTLFSFPLLDVLVLFGAFCLQTRRMYPMAMTACIVASIPCCSPGCILGIPFGIWGLVVLNDDAVKRSFG